MQDYCSCSRNKNLLFRMTLIKCLWVFLGGGLGSLCRFALNHYSLWPEYKFPIATFLANLVSTSILGFAYKYQLQNPGQQWVPFFIMIGFCGALSTFSSFSSENVNLLRQSAYLVFSLYVVLSVGCCLFVFWLSSR